MPVPLSAPDITEAEIAAVTGVLRTSSLSLGPKLAEFEQAFANLTGVPHAVGVSSGTAGLHLAVRALGLGPGDEVIVPSFTFVAVANAVRYEGTTPVFCDIDPASLNLDPEAVEQAVTPRTRAIIMVHTFGRVADVDALSGIAQRHGLKIIEDACEAVGALRSGRPAGSFGDIAVFAFYPNKQITTGEGGMVVTRDAGLARRMRALRNQGRYDMPADEAPEDVTAHWLQHTEIGFNYRLSEIASALGLVQLARLEEILAVRESVAKMYEAALAHLSALELPGVAREHDRASWFVYVVRLRPGAGERLPELRARRDRVLTALSRQGIGCAPYFVPVHLQPAYRDQPLRCPLPATECESARTIALPFFNRLTADGVTEVARALEQGLKQPFE